MATSLNFIFRYAVGYRRAILFSLSFLRSHDI